MHRASDFATIAHDMGQILKFISVGTCVPLVICLIYQEWDQFLPMLAVPLLLFLIGLILGRAPVSGREARISQALFAVALIWIICAVVGAVPFTFGAGMPYLDSLFEAMSGWTDTGLSLANVDALSHTLIFWRSLMQWYGGLGIVAFTVVLLSRTGMSTSRMYRSEGRTESFMPSVVATGKQMWIIYLIITLISIILVCLSGIGCFDALNLAMAGIATGGFSPHSAGVSYYNNVFLELALIPVMIAGALPFKIYFLMYNERKFSLFHDEQARLLFPFIAICFAVFVWDFLSVGFSHTESLRQGIFMSVSAVTSTGFQVTSPNVWPHVTTLFVTIFLLIGGSSGSTAGGIKLSRIGLAYRGIIWQMKRTMATEHAVVPFRWEGRIVQKEIAEEAVSRNLLIIILFVLVTFVAVVLIMHFENPAIDTSMVLFEVATAIGNNGISTGFVNPGLSAGSKLVYIFIMWIGRLEVLPVIVLILGIIRGFEPEQKKARHSKNGTSTRNREN